ncbi:MAG: hypothetical protein QM820_53150 [Minicystis sp.]
MDSASGASNPFPTGSTAHAIVLVRRMISVCREIRRPALRASALVHLAAAARALERRYLGSAAVEGTLSREVLDALRALAATRERCEAGSAGALLVEHLTDRLGAEEAITPREVTRIAHAAEGLFVSAEAARLQRLSVELLSGLREQARARAEALPDGALRERALARIEDGLEPHPGRMRTVHFVGALQDAPAYRPSLPLVRELLVAGGEALPLAASMLPRIEGAAGQEARALWAMAAYPEQGPEGALKLLRAVRHRSAHDHGWLGLVGATLHAGRVDHADALLAHAPSRHLLERAELLIAEHLTDHDEMRFARRRLARVKDRSLRPAVEILLGWLDFYADFIQRAATRVLELPITLLAPPRRPPMPEPRIAGEPEPLETMMAREAWMLRIAIRRALDPEHASGNTRGQRQPYAWLSMFPDRLLPEALVVRAFEDRSMRRALFDRGDLWDHLLFPEHREPHDVRWHLEAEFDTTWITEECLMLLAQSATQRGTMADLDAAAPISREQAFALGVLGPASIWERCRRDPRLRDALGSARAHYDEGVSLTPRRKHHRAALLDAARGHLKRMLDEGIGASEEARESTLARIRCLQNLGGEQAASILQRLLSRSDDGGPALRKPMLEALAALAPQDAVQVFVDRYEALARDRQASWAAEQIEEQGLFPPGTARAHRSAFTRLYIRLGEQASRWLAGFVQGYARAAGTPPGPEVLALADDPDLPPSGEDRVRRILARRDALSRVDASTFLRTLAEEPDRLHLMCALNPVSPGRRAEAWDDRRWTTLLARLQRDLGAVASGPIASLRRRLHGSDAVIDALLRGAPPTAALARPLPIGSNGVHTLRYLDKRRDFPAFMRFADCVPCCFNSTSSMYGGTQRMLLALWKDPLSFCFQLVRAPRGGVAEAQGFVFGSFGLCEERPAILLNGIYLRRQLPWMRFAILAAIEESFCRPLGVRLIAVGARHGGRGPMPPDYVEQKRVAQRLRALFEPNGVLMTRIYDDLSTPQAGGSVLPGYGIHWKDLDA